MKVSNIALTGAVLGMAQASPIATREAITDGMSSPRNSQLVQL